jgi:RNA polymerase sigma-70 factor (ECF subfamily)
VEAEDFEQVQREYGDRLTESIAGFVRDRHRAEDLAAQAFERAWEKREDFRGEASLRTWIEAIARNEARQDWRSARHVQVDSLDGTGAREWPMPELVTDELEKREDHYHLQQALATLPINPRRALVAHFVEGLSIRDIARRERVPEGTVLSRIFTGKQLLREAWDALIAGPAAKATALESPSLQPEGQGSTESGRTANERPNAPEPMIWDR